MPSLLVIALLLTLLLGPAAATSPGMDPTLPIESLYPDPDGILDTFYHLCGCSINYCAHVLTNPPRRAPTFTAATFYEHPDWPQDALPGLEMMPEPEPEPEPERAPLPPSYFERQPLRDAIVQQFNDDATDMQTSTIQIHIEGTYTPGDRLASRAGSRQQPHRRQAPRPGGFPCTHEGCGEVFGRSCDLKRHEKKHLDRSERPHKCPSCNEGFLYPKDCKRHMRTHKQSSSLPATLYCSVPGCNNVDGFSRRDNLLRHQRNQHPHFVANS